MEEKDQTIMPTLTSDVRLKPMIEHSEILMETTTKKMGDMLKSMQEEIQNLESPQTIAYLIQVKLIDCMKDWETASCKLIKSILF